MPPALPTARGRRRRPETARSWHPTGSRSRGRPRRAWAIRSRSATRRSTRPLHLGAELERDPSGDLRGHREVVRKHDLLELLDHPRRGDREPEAQRGHRPHLRVGAHHREGRSSRTSSNALHGELAVGLVDHHQRIAGFEQRFDGGGRLDGAGRVVGSYRRTRWWGRSRRSARRRRRGRSRSRPAVRRRRPRCR